MLRLRTLWVVAALTALAALLLGSATASATAPPATTPSLTEPRVIGSTGAAATATPAPRAQAEAALAAVEDAFDGDTSQAEVQAMRGVTASEGSHVVDATPLILDLRRQLRHLSAKDRRTAVSYLGRPTQGKADPAGNGYRTTNVQTQCPTGEGFCLNWVTSTSDAPRLCTGPDLCSAVELARNQQIADTQEVMSYVWDRIVGDAKYRAPRKDKGSPTQGVNTKLDIYLKDLGEGLYGYCDIDALPRPSTGRDAAGYCVLDNDYDPADYAGISSLESLQVTAAHEFFHAVQFAYDVYEDGFLLEGTAAWIEDEVYDDVNDNRQYLASSPLRQLSRSLDAGPNRWYGTWSWWRFLSETYPADGGSGIPSVIRAIWERADDASPKDPGTYSLEATARAIKARGSVFYKTFARFSEVTRHPETFFEEATEGHGYPHSSLSTSLTLKSAKPASGEYKVTLNHLASRVVAFTPGSGVGAGWRLRVRVDTPHPARGLAQLTVYNLDGTPRTPKFISLNSKGLGTATVAFDEGVKRVELTLTNAGRRYKCDRGTSLACEGVSKDNNQVTYFRARAFK